MLQDEIRNELAVNKVFLQGCDKQARSLLFTQLALATFAPTSWSNLPGPLQRAVAHQRRSSSSHAKRPLGRVER